MTNRIPSGRISLESPDILIARTPYTQKGKPIRMVQPLTQRGEEWAIAVLGEFQRVHASFVIPKAQVEEVLASASKAGLIARKQT